ncbi:MAG: APC family permease [Bacteroidota bacterium]
MISKKYFTWQQLASILIASMIGTGVFTSLGFQVLDIHNSKAIVFLWLLGGALSLLGAISYARLATHFPSSGGEYNYLSRLFHPSFGFTSGYISILVGFAAPIAAACYAFGGYFVHFNPILTSKLGISFTANQAALSVLILLTGLNFFHKILGAKFQVVFTAIKIVTMLLLIVAGLIYPSNNIAFENETPFFEEILSPSFAIAIFWVSYSYSGWNALCYISGEIENPKKTIMKSLVSGTLFVTIVYILINWVFLKHIPVSEMAGKPDLVEKYAQFAFGSEIATFANGVICILLISTINSMLIIGPRVSTQIGKDYNALKFLSQRNKNDVPQISLLIQFGLSCIYLITSSFESLIVYIGFVLSLFTFSSILGLIIYEWRKKMLSIKTIFAPAVFLLFNFWILVYGAIEKPIEMLVGISACFSGFVLYHFIKKTHAESD